MPTEAIIWVIVIAAVLIAIPIVASVIRDRDFKRQASGKKKERKYNKPVTFDKPPVEDPKNIELKEEARRRSLQNMM